MSPLTTTFSGSDSTSGVHAAHHDALAVAVNALQVQIPLSLGQDQLIVGNTTDLVIQDSGLTWDNTAKQLVVGGVGGVKATQLTVTTAIGKIIPGATSLALRNNADSANNLIITDAGQVTARAGVIVTAGGLRVTAGNVGIGSNASVDMGLQIAGSVLASSTTQYGLFVDAIPSAAATVEMNGAAARANSNASAYTLTSANSYRAFSPLKGAGSTITNARGMLIDGISSGNINNYGLDVGAPTGGSGDNLSIRATGAIRFSGLGAFVASDKYVIVDASGNLHKSALGPAS
jgi:hypothetical protein